MKLNKWQGKPYITIQDKMEPTIFKIIDAITSYKIKNFEFIDNSIYKCPKCGFWITVAKAKSDFCKRCGTQCELGTWDGMIRLLSKTRQGTWYFPAGLLDNVEEAMRQVGVTIEVGGWPRPPNKNDGGLAQVWTGPTMRSHQDEALKKALSKFINGRGVVLEMPTGSGKTMTAMKLMHELNTTTLILVHKKNLLEQWANVIRNVLHYEPDLYGDATKDVGPITIGMVQSIANAAAFPMNMFNFVITDECVDGETLIETDAGKMKIKDIVNKQLKVKVKTHTGKLKKIKRYHKIKTSKPMVCIVLENGILECTEDHKILTSDGWKEAKDLLPGMNGIKMGNTINNSILHKGICDENFRKARVLSIERIDKTIRRSGSDEIQNTVYDLEIEDDHSYIANGIIVHNCHHTPADQTYKILMKSDAYYKLGLSATPKREDGNELKMFAAIGQLVSVTSVKELIKNGTLAKPTIQFINAPSAFEGRTYAESYKNQITLNDSRNRLIAQKAYELQKKGMSVLITVNQIKHGKTLETMIKGSKFVHGKTKTEERQNAMKEFENGQLSIMISTLLNEGADIPTLDALIMAGGGKSEGAQIQKIGRALRTTDSKKTAIIIDVLDGGKWLRDHAQNRVRVYKDVFG